MRLAGKEMSVLIMIFVITYSRNTSNQTVWRIKSWGWNTLDWKWLLAKCISHPSVSPTTLASLHWMIKHSQQHYVGYMYLAGKNPRWRWIRCFLKPIGHPMNRRSGLLLSKYHFIPGNDCGNVIYKKTVLCYCLCHVTLSHKSLYYEISRNIKAIISSLYFPYHFVV